MAVWSPLPIVQQWIGENPTALGLAGAAVVVLGIVTVWLIRRMNGPSPEIQHTLNQLWDALDRIAEKRVELDKDLNELQGVLASVNRKVSDIRDVAIQRGQGWRDLANEVEKLSAEVRALGEHLSKVEGLIQRIVNRLEGEPENPRRRLRGPYWEK